MWEVALGRGLAQCQRDKPVSLAVGSRLRVPWTQSISQLPEVMQRLCASGLIEKIIDQATCETWASNLWTVIKARGRGTLGPAVLCLPLFF